MNSLTYRTVEKRKTQDDIKRQIELLRAQLDEAEDEPHEDVAEKESDNLKERKSGEGVKRELMLAPATPSPRKKRKMSQSASTLAPISKPVFHPKSSTSFSSSLRPSASQTNPPTFQLPTRPTSTLFSTLRRLENSAVAAEDENEEKEQIERTVGFGDRPHPRSRTEDTDTEGKQQWRDEAYHHQKRDERLVLVEDFQMGPYEFTPRVDDPEFEAFEPHSGIALSSRVFPHADLSDYLVGRFYISPSSLYSLLRVDPFSSISQTNKTTNKGGYDLDVPVPGDWVTIAVIAERGPIRYTKAPVGVERDEEDAKTRKRRDAPGPGKKEKPAPPEEEGGRGGGKKYVTLKMIDFGARSQSSSGGHGQIRGDAFLNLILFEADGVDLITRGCGLGTGTRNGKAEEKVYKGGSGGAFEKLMDVREGDVVALLNPRVLKPFQRTTTTTSPHTTILALTPPSASSILIIGRSRDLGMCTVLKADGKVCGAWCDKRAVVGNGKEKDKDKGGVCEYHLERAVTRRRAGRNEFAAGTSGMSTAATHKRKHDYDPLRQWGLKPLNDSGSGSGGGSGASARAGLGATYLFAGHVVSNRNATASSMFVNETMGREAQAKARRKMGGAKIKEEELVSRMVGKGKGKRKRTGNGTGTGLDKRGKGKGKDLSEDSEGSEDEDKDEEKEGKEKKAKPLYSAEFISKLGFDPSSKAGAAVGKGGISKSVQDKLDALAALQRSRRQEIELGPRPGGRVRSGVVVPPSASNRKRGEESEGKKSTGTGEDENMVDLDDEM